MGSAPPSPTKSKDPLLADFDVGVAMDSVHVDIKKSEDGTVPYEVSSTLIVSGLLPQEGASIVEVDGIAVATFEDYENAIKDKDTFTLTLQQQSEMNPAKPKAATGGYRKARQSKHGKDSKGK